MNIDWIYKHDPRLLDPDDGAVCPLCGSMVFLKEQHVKFHAQLRRMARKNRKWSLFNSPVARH